MNCASKQLLEMIDVEYEAQKQTAEEINNAKLTWPRSIQGFMIPT
jgi:hypothetical protein